MANYEMFNVLSLNVRGIGDGKKRREIFRWLKRYHSGGNSIVFLQETHSTTISEHVWQQEWGSKIFFSHGTSKARGVAILMPNKFNFDITELWKDDSGRILALILKTQEKTVNLVNIYAPTKDKSSEQIEFLKT